MTAPLRIALLAHSTNPRGGVVHALALGEALVGLGHEVSVHAPDPKGTGFFRPTPCRTVSVAATEPVDGPGDVTAMVEARVRDYVRHFEPPARRAFDVWHAQDGISANALATLKELGLISGFARTVHHVDAFEDPRLTLLQLRAITTSDRLFVVSRMWQYWLARELGLTALAVGNGVDTRVFTPRPDATDAVLRHRLGLVADGPVFLAIGGVEERKNTLRVLAAFRNIHARDPSSQLVIAGGASFLDHGAYQTRFAAALAESGLPAEAVVRTGPLPQDLMPALYRAATTLVFPSTREGFGLVVLEAMASGVPVVTSRIAPFTEYLGEDDVAWCDPFDSASISAAMAQTLASARREALIVRGAALAARHDWAGTARAHLPAYEDLAGTVHA